MELLDHENPSSEATLDSNDCVELNTFKISKSYPPIFDCNKGAKKRIKLRIINKMIFFESNIACLSTIKIDNKKKFKMDGKIKDVLIAKINPRVIKRKKTALIRLISLKNNNAVIKLDAIIKKDKIDSLLVRISYHINSGIIMRKIIYQSFLVLLFT